MYVGYILIIKWTCSAAKLADAILHKVMYHNAILQIRDDLRVVEE